MKLPTSLLLLAIAGSANAQTAAEPQASGPRGSSQVEAGEIRYDEVGYAGTGGSTGMTAASAGLAAGSFAEVTALDSGKTVLVAIDGGTADAGQLISLSPNAAAALGIAAPPAGVRVRLVTPTPQDASLLTTRQIASGRADAPPVLLVPLRKKLAALPVPVAVTTSKPVAKPAKTARKPVTPTPLAATPAKAVPTPRPATPAPPPAATGDYLVQIATLSDATRARALAAKVGGRVISSGALFRVQTGPFADRAAALRGQAAAGRLGYRDAQIIRNNK